MSYIVRFRTKCENEQVLLTTALWVRDILGAKVTGAGGNSDGEFTFDTADTTFNEMVATIQAVKAQVPQVKYNFEMM